MKLEPYRRVRAAIVVAIAVLMGFAVVQNSLSIAVATVTSGIVALSLLRRRLTELEHDERTVLIRRHAASTTLAIATVGMAIIGLSLVFLSGRGIGNYAQVGYLLAVQANLLMALQALVSYYYRSQLGG